MKKKFLALLLAVLMVVSLLPTVAFAAGTGETGYVFYTDADGSNPSEVSTDKFFKFTVTKADPKEVSVAAANDITTACTILPSVSDGTNTYNVTSIADNGFKSAQLTSVTIPSGVTSIGKNAFDGCSGLTSVAIPSSVTSIGNKAFANCTSVADLYIDSIESWFGITFPVDTTVPFGVSTDSTRTLHVKNDKGGYDAPEELVISKDISSFAFYNCSSLKRVTIQSGVTKIDNRAFQKCENLTSVTIPSSVTSIGNYAFNGCSGLTSVTIPSSVTSIGNYAFSGCSTLNTVNVKATDPPTLGTNLFGSSPASVLTIYVPKGTGEAYKAATKWSTYEGYIEEAYMVDVATATNGTVTVDKDFVPTDAESKTVTVTATPNEGYQLKSLSYYTTDPATTTSITGNSFEPMANVTVTAEFEEIPTYGIISEAQGHGSVTTKIGDADVTEAVEGASVVFTATADEGYQFKEWVDVRGNANISGHTTDNPLTVTMPAAEIKVKAVFEKAAPTVTIETNGHGTVTAYIDDGVDGITDSTFTVPAGSKVILYSVADEGYHLNEWVDMRSNVTIKNGNTFIMPDKDVKIKAVYSDTLRADYLSYIEGYYDNDMMPGDFSILVNSDGMTTLINGDGSLQTWDELDIVAEELIVSPDDEEDYGIPAGSYTSYAIVTSDGFGCPFYKLQDGKCKKTVNPAAGFFTRTAQPFNIIVEDDGHGMAEAQIDGTAVESAATGADVDLVITSTNEGYAFKEWQVIRGLESGVITDNSFTMPGNEVKLKAIFERVYNINMQDDGHGTAVAKIGDSEVTAAAGGNGITLVPQAAEGYELDRWEIVSGDFTITGNGFTMPDSNVTIRATFKVKEVCDCEYTKTVKLTEDTLGMKLNCKDMGKFTFAQFDGGWSINNGEKFLAMKDGKLALSDDPFAWTYKSGAFSASVKTTQEVKSSYGILGWLFGWGSKTTTKTVTTTYYLSTVTENAKLSTCCVCAELYKTVTANEHDFGCWIDCKDGNHKHICKNCGEVETEAHSYDETTHKCVCGAYDPSKVDVKISVDVKTKTTKQFSGFLFWGTWKNVTTYTATIKTVATGVKVTKVQYQLNGGKWMTGTCVCSDEPIETLKVKAWDSNGNVHEYTYSNN